MISMDYYNSAHESDGSVSDSAFFKKKKKVSKVCVISVCLINVLRYFLVMLKSCCLGLQLYRIVQFDILPNIYL